MQEKESKTNWHFRISLAKSGFRIAAGLSLFGGGIMFAGAMLVVAEALGIAEEFDY